MEFTIEQVEVLRKLRKALDSPFSRSVKLERAEVPHGTALVIEGLAARTRDNRYECTMSGVKLVAKWGAM